MLDHCNSHAKCFQMARDRLKDEVVLDVKLKLIFNREKDERIYNIPIVSEVVALITRDANIGSTRDIILKTRDIILKTQTGQLQRINELHTSYLALQYPLLFPYGEDGYRHDVLHRNTSMNQSQKRV